MARAHNRQAPPRFAFLDHPRPLAFAHRGGALEGEENTMPAFERAVALGYRYLETDVQASRDGIPVVFHDATLQRMTGEPVRLCDLDWATLSRIRTKGGAELVRLDDLLSAWPDIRINLDPKSDRAVEPMARALLSCNAVERVSVGSFSGRRIRRMRRLIGPRLCWSPSHAGVARLWCGGWGLPIGGPAFPTLQVPTRFRGIPLVTPRFIAAAHRRNIQVHVWTVDEEVEMERLLDMRVDGLMTDRPALLKQVLERRGQWTGG